MKFPVPEEEKPRILINLFMAFVTVLMVAVLVYARDIWSVIMTVLHSCMPFLIGILLVFVQMPMVNWLERVFTVLIPVRNPPKKLYRTLGAIVSLMVVIGCIAVFLLILLPQVTHSIQTLIVSGRSYVEQNVELISELLVKNGFAQFDGSKLVMAWERIIKEASNYFKLVFNSAVMISSSIYRGTLQLLIGLVAAVYFIVDREHFCAIGKKLTYAFCPKETADYVIKWTREAGSIFSSFIFGKILDSLIIGLICYFLMLVFHFDYALLISLIVGVTNVLPFFGPFIGAIPSALILVVSNEPIQAVWFLVMIVALQQLDGNVIGPLILGDQVGISAFWIMASILVGAGLFGFMGMLLGVPIGALLYALIKAAAEKRLADKGMKTESEAYIPIEEPAYRKTNRRRKDRNS